ncbi:MAG: DUF5723 family protein [Bacteroidota bacterium]|nr:DUF5723 family protein [Bacteroidota bacterium]MDP4275507.1 DUF5723 family protein [Bacteroidota bacterium]
MNLHNKILLLFLMLVCTFPLQAQQNTTMYHMYGVPQSNSLNPAFQSSYNFYIGIPAIAPLYVNGNNNPLSFDDIVKHNDQIDSLITPFHPKGNRQEFLNLFKDNNFVNGDFSTGLFSIGLRINEMFFTFDINDKASVHFNYPKDLITAALSDGFPDNTTYNWSKLGIDAQYYREYALGVSRHINDRLTLGLKGKLLFGKADIHTTNSLMKIRSGYKSWDLQSDATVHSSLPFVKWKYDKNGKLDWDNIETKKFKGDTIRQIVMNTGNPGFALDAGFEYKVDDHFTVSGSLIDLGFIRWRKEITNLSLKGNYTFEGELVNSYNKDSISDAANAILDTLKNEFYLEGHDAYTTYLSGKMYLGASYNFNNRLSFGLLSSSQIYNKKLYQQLTLSCNLQPIRLLSTSVCYSLLNNKSQNLGFGLSLKLINLNIYAICDQVPLHWAKSKNSEDGPGYIPYKTKGMDLRLGVNLVFGKEKSKKRLQDQPLIE